MASEIEEAWLAYQAAKGALAIAYQHYEDVRAEAERRIRLPVAARPKHSPRMPRPKLSPIDIPTI